MNHENSFGIRKFPVTYSRPFSFAFSSSSNGFFILVFVFVSLSPLPRLNIFNGNLKYHMIGCLVFTIGLSHPKPSKSIPFFFSSPWNYISRIAWVYHNVMIRCVIEYFEYNRRCLIHTPINVCVCLLRMRDASPGAVKANRKRWLAHHHRGDGRQAKCVAHVHRMNKFRPLNWIRSQSICYCYGCCSFSRLDGELPRT